MRERGVRVLAIALATCAACATVVSTARAQSSEREAHLSWEPYRRVGLREYAITLSGPLVLRLANFGLTEPTRSRIHGGVLFDDAVRSALVLETRAARDDADMFSDISWASSMAYPFADALVVAWAVRASPDVAFQMLVISAQSMSIAALVTELAIHHLGRERPGQEDCERDVGYSATCIGPTAFHSLPSGHTAGAFTGAALACAHHLNLPLYGSTAADVTACGLALAWASAGATARILADRHWASDVFAGVALGLGLGWLLPQLVYYVDVGSEARAALFPLATPTAFGLQGVGEL